MALTQPHHALLRRAQAGDERAFEELVTRYQAPLFTYVLRIVSGDRGLAEDLCQDVFLRVYQSLPAFSLRASFTTWLFQIAKHRVYDELRARERRVRPTGGLTGVAAAAPPADAAIEDMDEVWRAIGALPLDLKTALLLRDVVGLSYLEIAAVVDVSLATVKWRIFKARDEVHLAFGAPRRAPSTAAGATLGQV